MIRGQTRDGYESLHARSLLTWCHNSTPPQPAPPPTSWYALLISPLSDCPVTAAAPASLLYLLWEPATQMRRGAGIPAVLSGRLPEKWRREAGAPAVTGWSCEKEMSSVHQLVSEGVSWGGGGREHWWHLSCDDPAQSDSCPSLGQTDVGQLTYTKPANVLFLTEKEKFSFLPQGFRMWGQGEMEHS